MCNNGFVNSPINNDFTNNFSRLYFLKNLRDITQLNDEIYISYLNNF